MKKTVNNQISRDWPIRLAVIISFAVVVTCLSSAQAVIVKEFDVFKYAGGNYNRQDFDFWASLDEIDGLIRFEFHNDSLVFCSIDALYLENGVLGGLVGLEHGNGTFLEIDKKVSQLPGGNTLTDAFEAAYSFNSGSPSENNGIEPGEYTTIIFDFVDEADFDDLLVQLQNGGFRLGLQITGSSPGLRASAVNSTPEPATLTLLGLGCVLFLRKKKL